MALAFGIDVLGDEREASIAVNDFHNGHRANKKDNNLTSVAQLRHDGLVHVRIMAHNGIDGPQDAACDQGKGSLVHVEGMFQCNQQVTDHKDGNHRRNHRQMQLFDSIS